MRRSNHNAIGKLIFTPSIIGENGMRNHRSGSIFISFRKHHIDSIGRQHFNSTCISRNRKSMCINPKK